MIIIIIIIIIIILIIIILLLIIIIIIIIITIITIIIIVIITIIIINPPCPSTRRAARTGEAVEVENAATFLWNYHLPALKMAPQAGYGKLMPELLQVRPKLGTGVDNDYRHSLHHHPQHTNHHQHHHHRLPPHHHDDDASSPSRPWQALETALTSLRDVKSTHSSLAVGIATSLAQALEARGAAPKALEVATQAIPLGRPGQVS
jgi:hypothetical protein